MIDLQYTLCIFKWSTKDYLQVNIYCSRDYKSIYIIYILNLYIDDHS